MMLQEKEKKVLGKSIFKIVDHTRFFELLQNAISFKPITDVSTFVNGFLLKDDPIKLDALKQEIRSYQDINKMLQREELKQNLLETFVSKAEKYVENLRTLRYLDVLKTKSSISKYEYNLHRKKIEYDRMVDDANSISMKLKELDERKSDIQFEIRQYEENEEYKALLNKQRKLNELKVRLDNELKSLEYYNSLIKSEASLIRKLDLNYRLDEDAKAKDYTLLKTHANGFKKEKDTLNLSLSNERGEKNYEIKTIVSKLQSLRREYDDLQKGIANYPDEVKLLIDVCNSAIKKEFPKDKNVFVRPLCEYLEVKDEKWSKALEGYLNTQKFNLIVDYKYYDCCAREYEKIKETTRIYGVGIVNSKGISSTKKVPNSLFSKLDTIKNKIAEKYAESILDGVTCCDKVENTKQYEAAVTPTVMIYKNGVLRAARPESYMKPFIGKESQKKRMELLTKEIEQSTKRYHEIEKEISLIDTKMKLLTQSRIDEIIKMDNIWLLVDNDTKNYNELKSEIERDQVSNGLLDITNKIALAKERLYKLNSEIAANSYKHEELLVNQGTTKGICESLAKTIDELIISYNESYEKITDKNDYNEFITKYVDGEKYNDDLINSEYDSAKYQNNSNRESIVSGMSEYTRLYRPSFTASIDNAKDYINEYYQLKNRGVLEYREQAKLAYERAEKSFREDFIAKLNANIEDAVSTLKRINKNLDKHPFGTEKEKYEFTYKPTGVDEFANYYRIITSGKLLESKDLFTEILSEADMIIMKELFDKISMETNSNEAEKELSKYLDYRNYMNYDIKITNESGAVTYFSKINKEKSGGETQTPFYIVMASCFDELIDRDKGSTSVVVFDEAFNNMDEGRTKALMEFYKQLDIQIIIVVPSLRMHTISHYMDTVIGIVKENNYPHIVRMGEKL